jgi:very-short-patch-repair endonuclease
MTVYGYEKLHSQIIEFVQSELDWKLKEREVGDSEIEKLFFLSLETVTRFATRHYQWVRLVKTKEEEDAIKYRCQDDRLTLLVRPQAHVLDYRVDFLIHALDHSVYPDIKWRRLVVECDGHNFHERTKEQAAKDRARDRDLSQHDFDVFRFTGSEIWKDPMGCANQVDDWAVKSWF